MILALITAAALVGVVAVTPHGEVVVLGLVVAVTVTVGLGWLVTYPGRKLIEKGRPWLGFLAIVTAWLPPVWLVWLVVARYALDYRALNEALDAWLADWLAEQVEDAEDTQVSGEPKGLVGGL